MIAERPSITRCKTIIMTKMQFTPKIIIAASEGRAQIMEGTIDKQEHLIQSSSVDRLMNLILICMC